MKRMHYLLIVSAGLAVGFVLAFQMPKTKSLALITDSAGSQNQQKKNDAIYIFDRCAMEKGILVSKSFSKKHSGVSPSTGDLWLRNGPWEERLIATNVIRAVFSPDSRNIAYATGTDEVFIETVEGQQVTRLARAGDPVWRSDSTALSVSVTVSVEYPEYQQFVTYHIQSREMSYSSSRR